MPYSRVDWVWTPLPTADSLPEGDVQYRVLSGRARLALSGRLDLHRRGGYPLPNSSEWEGRCRAETQSRDCGDVAGSVPVNGLLPAMGPLVCAASVLRRQLSAGAVLSAK